jgi:hypothetical protein
MAFSRTSQALKASLFSAGMGIGNDRYMDYCCLLHSLRP